MSQLKVSSINMHIYRSPTPSWFAATGSTFGGPTGSLPKPRYIPLPRPLPLPLPLRLRLLFILFLPFPTFFAQRRHPVLNEKMSTLLPMSLLNVHAHKVLNKTISNLSNVYSPSATTTCSARR